MDEPETRTRHYSRRRHLFPVTLADIRKPVQRVRSVVRNHATCAGSVRVLRLAAVPKGKLYGDPDSPDEQPANRSVLRHDRHNSDLPEQPQSVPGQQRRRNGRHGRIYANAVHRRTPLGSLRHHHRHAVPNPERRERQ